MKFKNPRMTMLGVMAWISLCLLVAGLFPNTNSQLSRLWTCSGLLGLVSVVGLAEVAKSELRCQEELLATYVNEARTDPLTGLANRRALEEELKRRIALNQRYGTPLSLMIVDVDHFKGFNDNYGHQTGDEMLRSVAHALESTVREMDLVTRFGGEEFAIVLPETSLNDAKTAAERIRTAVSRHESKFRGNTFQVTVSVGVAEVCELDSPSELMRRTDAALYAAKQSGRNCSCYHTQDDCRIVEGTQPDESPHDLGIGDTILSLDLTASRDLSCDERAETHRPSL